MGKAKKVIDVGEALLGLKSVAKKIESATVDDITKVSANLIEENINAEKNLLKEEVGQISKKTAKESLDKTGSVVSEAANRTKRATELRANYDTNFESQLTQADKNIQARNLDNLQIEANKSSLPGDTQTIVSGNGVFQPSEPILPNAYQPPENILDTYKSSLAAQPSLIETAKMRAYEKRTGSINAAKRAQQEEISKAKDKLNNRNMAGQKAADRAAERYHREKLPDGSDNPYDKIKARWGQITPPEAPAPPINENTPWGGTMKAVLGTAVGGAALIGALNSSRGQQNNAQLYGQQPLY